MRTWFKNGVVVSLLLSVTSVGSGQVNEIVLRVNDRIATTYDYNSERAERYQAIQQAESLSEERKQELLATLALSLIHISEPTRQPATSRMPSSA